MNMAANAAVLTMDEDAADLTFFPQDAPRDGDTVFLNRYWIKHPTHGLVVYRHIAPQCTTYQSVAERLLAIYPWAVIEFLPVAYVRINYQ